MTSLSNVIGKLQLSSSFKDDISQTSRLCLPTALEKLEAQEKFAFLKELTSSSKHLHKSFYEHLCNVYMYLHEQKLPEDVCNAGLFHSVYGTEFYEFSSSRITREVVRGYIGDYAEELVHLFCGFKKNRFKAIVGNALGLSKQQQLDLCYVEFANLWDQRQHGELQERLDILTQTIARLETADEE